MGRGTIREAVKLLAARNVLVVQRGRGTFIAKHPGQIDDPLGFAFFEDKIKLAWDLLEVRMHLEPWIAALAAERATEQDIEELKARCAEVEEDIFKGDNHLPNDQKFHMCIARCSQNDVVPKLIPVIAYSVDLLGTLNEMRLLSETIIGHRAITDAIIAHDPEAARQAMLSHLEQNKATIEELAAEQGN